MNLVFEMFQINASRISPRIAFLVLALTLIFSTTSIGQSTYEDELISSLQQIQNQEIGASLKSLTTILERYPNSKIGHLVLADLLAARSGSKNLIQSYNSDSRQLHGLRDEIKLRWESSKHLSPAHLGKIPESVVLPAPNQAHVLVVDASAARLYVYRNDGGFLTLIDDFYMTIGKSGMGKNLEGDLRTPIGVYHVTSYLPGDQLPDRYGPGAFPINYPNAFDKLNKRTGYGIWIHGTESDNYNRVPLASDGCVSLSNEEFIEISRYIKTDGTTPVIVSANFNWLNRDGIKTNQSIFNFLLHHWRTDWESKNHENYIRHYSISNFRSGEYHFDNWSKHTKKIQQSQDFIDIDIQNLSIFAYPGEDNLVMMSFDQHYQTNNHSNHSRKTLFWKKEIDDTWKIIYEG